MNNFKEAQVNPAGICLGKTEVRGHYSYIRTVSPNIYEDNPEDTQDKQRQKGVFVIVFFCSELVILSLIHI